MDQIGYRTTWFPFPIGIWRLYSGVGGPVDTAREREILRINKYISKIDIFQNQYRVQAAVYIPLERVAEVCSELSV